MKKKKEAEPIYRFDGLKKMLEDMGYRVDKAVGYRPVENKEVNLNDVRHNMEFADDGIFLFDEVSGTRQQIFLYKRMYHLGYGEKPRFHIRKCRTIQSFIDSGRFSEYRRANTEEVLVNDMDDGNRVKPVRNLPLCKCCLEMIAGGRQAMTTSDFVRILKEAKDETANAENVEVDIFGYTKDWEKISKAYREENGYTCERCGLRIENPFDQYFIHVHHKNGNKLDNRKRNLECLCMGCHAHVDAVHEENLTTGANKVIYDDFCRKYR